MSQTDPYRVLAEKHGYAASDRYRRILEHLMTVRQAQIAVELPKTPQELSAKFGIDIASVDKELDEMFRKGVVFPKNIQTLENYRFARNADQLHDSTISHLSLDPVQDRKIFELWEDFDFNEGDHDRVGIWGKMEQPPFRVLPAYKAVQNNLQLMPCEDAREILKAASSIAVVACPCRRKKQAVGKKCHKSHDVNCLQLGRGAEYAITRGSGNKLSLEQALDLLAETEDDGLVHCWINSTSMSYTVMCSCCSDCCVAIEPMERLGVPLTRFYQRSRYEARVNPDLCNGCKICVRRCQFDAIQMVGPDGSKKLKAKVDPGKCIGCGACPIKCKPKAITLEVVRPPEFIPTATNAAGNFMQVTT